MNPAQKFALDANLAKLGAKIDFEALKAHLVANKVLTEAEIDDIELHGPDSHLRTLEVLKALEEKPGGFNGLIAYLRADHALASLADDLEHHRL